MHTTLIDVYVAMCIYAYVLVAPSSITSAICPNVMNGKQHVMRADSKTQQRRQKNIM